MPSESSAANSERDLWQQPNAVLHGEHVVHADTTLSKTGCQAVEFLTNFSRPDGVPEGWHSCGLPPFATVYAGQYDDEAHEDVQPVLCWKHLLKLGNTGDLVVCGMSERRNESSAATVLSRLWNELGEKEQRWISGDLERDVLAILSRRSVESESAQLEAHYENALTRIANAAQTTGHRVMRDIARRALEESHV